MKLGFNQHAVARYAEFIWYRAIAELRADVSRGFLGFAWWVIEPVLYMGAFYAVFGLVFKQDGENYVPFLLCGLVTWKWFDSSVRNGSMSIQFAMVLIYQVYLPKIVFPIISLVVSTLRFTFVFIILLFFLLLNDLSVTPAWFTDLLALIALQIALMLGLAMTFSAIVPFFPDLKFLIDNGMLLMFFLSGIFFRFSAVPEKLRVYYGLNPMFKIINGYREILIAGKHLDWPSMVPVMLFALIFLSLGILLLIRWNRVYAKKAFL